MYCAICLRNLKDDFKSDQWLAWIEVSHFSQGGSLPAGSKTMIVRGEKNYPPPTPLLYKEKKLYSVPIELLILLLLLLTIMLIAHQHRMLQHCYYNSVLHTFSVGNKWKRSFWSNLNPPPPQCSTPLHNTWCFPICRKRPGTDRQHCTMHAQSLVAIMTGGHYERGYPGIAGISYIFPSI